MALDIDLKDLDLGLDTSSIIQKNLGKVGSLAKMFAPVDVDLVGTSRLAFNGISSLEQFVEEKNATDKALYTPDIDYAKSPTLTFAAIEQLPRKLFLINGMDITNPAQYDPSTIAEWANSKGATDLLTAIQNRGLVMATNLLDHVALHGKTVKGSVVAGDISYADQSTNVVAETASPRADFYSASDLMVDDASYALFSNRFKSSLNREAETAQSSNVPKVNRLGDLYDYEGLVTDVTNNTLANDGYIFSSGNFEWGMANIDKIRIESGGLQLLKQDLIAVRYEIFVRWLWTSLDSVAIIAPAPAERKATK